MSGDHNTTRAGRVMAISLKVLIMTMPFSKCKFETVFFCHASSQAFQWLYSVNHSVFIGWYIAYYVQCQIITKFTN